MRYTTDTEPKLVALLDAAQREPVFIERDQQNWSPYSPGPSLMSTSR